MPIITCPHCGTRRNTPADRLPKNKTRARCPACAQSFDFDPARLSVAPPVAASRTVTCPHCQLQRQLPGDRSYAAQATINCRRCQQSFRLDATPPPARPAGNSNDRSRSEPKLSGIGSLLTDSWELFCRRGWSLLGIYLVTALLIIAPLFAGAMLLPQLGTDRPWLAWSCVAAGLLYLLFGSAWMTGALFHFTVSENCGFKAALGRARNDLGKFTWLLLLLGLLISGGSLLFLLPGLIFMIWFFFCQYILAEQGVGGVTALARSRQLVRGHWWAVFGRFMLLLLISTAVSSLAARLPIIGSSLNLLFTLLLTPFALCYYFLLYKDLQRCQTKQNPPASATNGVWSWSALALCGWLLLPAGFFLANLQESFDFDMTRASSPREIVELLTEPEASLALLTEEATTPVSPQALTAEEYDRLLHSQTLPDELQGVRLGPAVLTAERFWSDEQNPHMWLEVQLAKLPNLALSARRSARVLIEQVLDHRNQNRYAGDHSFEGSAFEWIQIRPSETSRPGFRGIRNVYLKQGTLPEQIRSISGQLELTLPLGIETLELKRSDIGREIQIAGQTLELTSLGGNRLSLSFQGKPAQLLSIRAVDQQAQPLRDAGSIWLAAGKQNDLQQMFAGEIDAVTVLIAADSITRSYPFEITR